MRRRTQPPRPRRPRSGTSAPARRWRRSKRIPPEKLEDWPDDEAKYETFGGSEAGESTYDEEHEEALGAHSVRHHEDGSVEVKGEKVDNPDDFKGEPIPGGPTDPDAPDAPGEDSDSGSSEDSDSDSSEDDSKED